MEITGVKIQADNNALTAEKIGMIELVLLQLANDYWIRLSNIPKVRNGKGHAERLIVGSAFNECYKTLKRDIISLDGKEAYDSLMESIVDNADNLAIYVDTLYNCYYSECVSKMKIDCCEEMSLNLTISTLLKLSNSMCRMCLKKDNNKTMNVISAFDKFSDKQTVYMLSDNFCFNSKNITKHIEYILQKITNHIQYEN